jgi:hypothetical protein
MNFVEVAAAAAAAVAAAPSADAVPLALDQPTKKYVQNSKILQKTTVF